MTLGGGKDGEGGIQLQWPLVAIFATIILSMVTGAIQLGSVQTHVQVNTGRLDLLEARERDGGRVDSDMREKLSRNEQSLVGLQKRLDSMEARALRALDEIVKRDEAINAKIDALTRELSNQRRNQPSYGAAPYDGTPESRTGNGLWQRSPP